MSAGAPTATTDISSLKRYISWGAKVIIAIAKTTKNVLGKLFVALKLGKLDSVRSIIKPNTKTVIFSIPFKSIS